MPVAEERIRRCAADAAWVGRARGRLGDLGWFMKRLKEPLGRQDNREDGCTGAFWEGRFRSIAVLDDEALLAVALYMDLNPLAAGAAETPEDSSHTSLRNGSTMRDIKGRRACSATTAERARTTPHRKKDSG